MNIIKERIFTPGFLSDGKGESKYLCEVHAVLEEKDGKQVLHMTGTAGSGEGKTVKEIRKAHPAEGWTREMLDTLCDIWEEWHLNDLHPECEHQQALGWREKAKELIQVKEYVLTPEARHEEEEVEQAALAALRAGVPFTPTVAQQRIANMKTFITTYSCDGDPVVPQNYKPCELDPSKNKRVPRNGLDYNSESKLGLIGKPCPVCGYRYGSSWTYREVPKEIIDLLFSLPGEDPRLDTK